jgi:hypothetical protein
VHRTLLCGDGVLRSGSCRLVKRSLSTHTLQPSRHRPESASDATRSGKRHKLAVCISQPHARNDMGRHHRDSLLAAAATVVGVLLLSALGACDAWQLGRVTYYGGPGSHSCKPAAAAQRPCQQQAATAECAPVRAMPIPPTPQPCAGAPASVAKAYDPTR